METKHAKATPLPTAPEKPFRLAEEEHHLPPEFLPDHEREPHPQPISEPEPEPAAPYDAGGPRGDHGDPL